MWFLSACQQGTSNAQPDTKIQISFEPTPPAVGQCQVDLRVTDSAGQPLRFGHLKVEGNMNHAGMKPVFTELKEIEPGRYAGSIEFTMGGDWFLLLSAPLPDGGEWNAKVDVPAVKAKSL